VIITQRWPYATVAIVALNLVVFLATHGALQQEAVDYSQIQSRTVLLAAMHPEAPPATTAQQKLIASFRQEEPQEWERLSDQNRSPADARESQARTWDLTQVEQNRCAAPAISELPCTRAWLPRAARVADKDVPPRSTPPPRRALAARLERVPHTRLAHVPRFPGLPRSGKVRARCPPASCGLPLRCSPGNPARPLPGWTP
jgi:hypothetical protein